MEGMVSGHLSILFLDYAIPLLLTCPQTLFSVFVLSLSNPNVLCLMPCISPIIPMFSQKLKELMQGVLTLLNNVGGLQHEEDCQPSNLSASYSADSLDSWWQVWTWFNNSLTLAYFKLMSHVTACGKFKHVTQYMSHGYIMTAYSRRTLTSGHCLCGQCLMVNMFTSCGMGPVIWLLVYCGYIHITQPNLWNLLWNC